MKRGQGMVLLALLAVAAAPLRAQAGTHPNFTGTWVLDPTKTAATGQMPAPSAATFTIVQNADSLIVDGVVTSAEMGEIKRREVVGFDGKVWKNMVPQPGGDIETGTTINWDKDVLSFHLTASVQGVDVAQEQTWTMAPDGKSYTAQQVTSVGGQEYSNVTLVFVKKS